MMVQRIEEAADMSECAKEGSCNPRVPIEQSVERDLRDRGSNEQSNVAETSRHRSNASRPVRLVVSFACPKKHPARPVFVTLPSNFARRRQPVYDMLELLARNDANKHSEVPRIVTLERARRSSLVSSWC